MMVPAPVSVAAVESAATVESVSPSVIAIARADDDADANGRRRNVKHRARWWWWRVIVTGCGGAVRLNHFCAGIRAQSSSKPECEHRQCNNETFLSHDRIFLLLFRRFNPTMSAKLPRFTEMTEKGRRKKFSASGNGAPATTGRLCRGYNARSTVGDRR
jgi:hypothetical protein